VAYEAAAVLIEPGAARRSGVVKEVHVVPPEVIS
jgi:hypothetical protein